MTDRTLLQQALDALHPQANRAFVEATRDALRAALAQPEAEPVAWMDDFGNTFPIGANKGSGHWLDDHKRTWVPLYATPQAIDGFGGNLDSAFAPAPAVPRPDEFVCPYCFDQGAAPAPSNQLSGNSGTLSDDDEELLNAALMHVLSGKSEQPAPAPVVPDASMRIEVTLDDSPVPIPIEVRGTTQMLMRLEAYLNGRVREIEELRAAAPAVQPLTDEQMTAIYRRVFGLVDSRPVGPQIDFIRAIEQAHGIGTQGGGK